MPAERKPHRMRRPYALCGCLWRGICERRVQSHWANSTPYYRCRSPAEYALANRVEHPLNVCLRKDAILADVGGWLAREFAPHRLRQTIAGLAAAQEAGHPSGCPGALVFRWCPRGDLNTRSREISPIEEIMRSA